MPATLIFGSQVIAPELVEERAARTAAALAAHGIGENAVVALMLRNEPAFIDIMLAARRLGAYHCPINWHFKAAEAGHILKDSGAAILIVHADLLPQIAAGIPAGLPVIVVRPKAPTVEAFGLDAATWPAHAIAWIDWIGRYPPWTEAPRSPRGLIAYTSGTTGVPKGVKRRPATPEMVAAGAALALEINGIGPGMRALCSAPMYHSAPNTYSSQSTQNGALLVLEPKFDAERTLALIEAHRLSHAYLVPTMYVRMLRLPDAIRRKYDLSSMTFVASTGSPCAPDVKRAMIEWWGPVIHESYASSESGYITHISAEEWLKKPGSAGRAATNGTVRIYDEAGNALPPGEVGLIYCRQPAYPDFDYNHQSEARRAMERDGLVCLGDMGWMDADGYLFVSDRKSDMVIAGGVNIYPAEIEAVLIGMPGVADCAVFGIPDAEFGEALAAAIQPREQSRLTAESVRAWLTERIAGYKVPKVVTFHDQLPREDSGKIFKRRLKAPYWEKAGRNI
ncbi:MAG: AMP-binding protein [Burkholderiales bacterium]|nr:AMP-binding protein [Burkholderiales bacterium]